MMTDQRSACCRACARRASSISGNYLGALDNWVKLQDDYDCFFFVANWHVLTTDAENSGEAPGYTIEMVADWLGAGLDPERSTLFIQSLVPEHAELHLLFSMVTPVGWLERVPTYKEMVEQLGIESPSYGLLGYPLLQAADILMYKAHWVPVGVDQVPARRADARGGAALQQHVDAGLPRARGQADADPQGAGDRRAEDVEVARQRDLSLGLARGDHGQGQADGHGSRAQAAHRSRQSRHLPGLRSAPDLHARRAPARPARPAAARRASGASTARRCCSSTCCRRSAVIRERRQRFADKPREIVEILHEGSKRARKTAMETMDQVRAP